MKAIRVSSFGEPEVLKLADVPDPVPAMDQVLVEVMAAGVNPVDTYIRSGVYARLPDLPYTPGLDAAGIIRGIECTGSCSLNIGDRVWLSGNLGGAYAEMTLCAPSQVHRLPDRLTFQQGASIGVAYATAYRALFQRGNGKPGKTVLIHGATGGVGLAAVQFARAAGMRVFATGGTAVGRAELEAHGAAHVLDHTKEGYLEPLREWTHGHGVDLIIEMLANVNLPNDLNHVARGGCIVIVGSRGNVEVSPRIFMQRECDVRGLMLFNASPAEIREAVAAIQGGLESGALTPVVGADFPLAEASAAHAAVMAPGHRGKVVITCRTT